MNKFLLFIFFIISLASCNRKDANLKEILINADSIAVNLYKGTGRMDSVGRVLIIRDAATITSWVEMIIESRKAYQPHCGTDGSLHFFRNNRVVMDIYFRRGDVACRQFSYLLHGKWRATKLGEEAVAIMENW